jgi:hypothetical protein
VPDGLWLHSIDGRTTDWTEPGFSTLTPVRSPDAGQ